MPSAENVELRKEYVEIMQEQPNLVLTRYRGLKVDGITDLRRRLKDAGVQFKVVKNNVFKLALKERGDLQDFPIDSTLEGPLAVAFVGEDVPAAAKVLKDFSKENEAVQMVSGVLDSTYYDEVSVKKLADLPSREQILAQMAATINAPTTQIASTINNVMASLARAIKAVGEKNG